MDGERTGSRPVASWEEKLISEPLYLINTGRFMYVVDTVACNFSHNTTT